MNQTGKRILDSGLVVTSVAAAAIIGGPIAGVAFIAASGFAAIREYRRIPRPRLCINKYIASYTIVSRKSGDVVIVEEFYGVRAYGKKKLKEIQTYVESKSGFFSTPEYRDCQPDYQNVHWRWLDTKGVRRLALTTFEPPVGKEAISYSLHHRSHNLFAFNKRDRLDNGVLPDNAGSERARHPIASQIDTLTILVNFPDAVPADIWAEARSGVTPDAPVDAGETARLKAGSESSRVYKATVVGPRFHYSYHVAWKLPDEEEQQLALSADSIGLANELQQQMIQSAGGDAQNAVRKELTLIRDKIEEQYPSGDLNAALYVYRRISESGSLTCVADLKALSPNRQEIQVGRTLVGRCYRRNEVLRFNSMKPTSADDLAYEAVPGEESLAPPTVACCVPLVCPVPKGRKIGVLYLTTRSNVTKLSALLEDDNLSGFVKEITAWYAAQIPPALGIKDSIVRAP